MILAIISMQIGLIYFHHEFLLQICAADFVLCTVNQMNLSLDCPVTLAFSCLSWHLRLTNVTIDTFTQRPLQKFHCSRGNVFSTLPTIFHS